VKWLAHFCASVKGCPISASDLASYITGVYLPVCGGNAMPGI
jgi:hypothetical protein